MATSGVYSFSMTATEIIRDALEHLGVIDPEQPLKASDAASMLRSLEGMIRSFQAEGIGLWLNQNVSIFLPKSDQSVLLGPTGGNASPASGVVSTTLLADAAAGAAAIDVSSITGLANAMYIGIELDSGSMQWTTINGAPVGDTVALSAVLTGAASAGNAVFAYTTKIQRPLQIIELRRRDRYRSNNERGRCNLLDCGLLGRSHANDFGWQRLRAQYKSQRIF
jgi:hypothetical protein